MKKAVTIKDIAQQLNLSRNTVAKALNGRYVPEKTREAVLAKAQEMNYKSLSLTRIETGSKKYRILLISGKPLNNMNYFIPLIKGVENYCYEKNYELFQYTYNCNRTPFKSFADYAKELNADGIVAIECFDKDFILKLLNLGKPVCFNDFSASLTSPAHNFDIITANDEQCVSEMVKLLHAKYGVNKFAFVGDRRHCMSFNERYNGMLKGMLGVRCAHSGADDILCSDDNFDYGNPHSVKTEILKLRHRPECFICCNDFVARSVCAALKSLEIAVPQKAFVVGFDNVHEAVALSPSITTFSVNKEFLGKETLRTLVHRIENKNIPSRCIQVAAVPVMRETTDRV